MRSAVPPMANERATPRLAPDWNPAGSDLSPAEGFLLSRIDGRTSWEQLRQIGGIPPEEVDRCLERWLSEGILTVNGSAGSGAGARGRARAEAGAARGSDRFEAGIDLTRTQQARILEFEASLDQPYHSLLGVAPDADAKAIKRAYFELSREFHPDRHFRRNIGSFGPRLERIFMKVVEAYELLSDPATRAEVQRSLQQPPPPSAPPAGPEESGAPQPPPESVTGKRATLARLRRHFRIPEKVLTERRFKARQFYQAAMVSAKKGRWIEAGGSIRLAIAFDPWDDEYKRAFADVQAQVHQVRAAELLREADASLDARAQSEAMRMYEEALSYRPCDPETNHKAARLALDLGDLEAAREYAETACELSPKNAAPQRTLGKVLARLGMRDRAREALNRALEIDPDDPETKAEIEALKRSRSRKR